LSHPAPPQQQLSHAEARAQAKAAKAHAKSLRPWYKKKRFILPLLLVALIVLISVASKGGETTTADPAGSQSQPTQPKATNKPPAPAAAGVGDKVSAGDWDFTVTKIKCGVSRVGSQYLNKNPQGQFCLLNLSVTNNGNDAGTLASDNQKLLDKQGRTFSSDSEATIYADPGQNLFEQINPGNTLKGQIVFDIPKNAKPVQAQLAGGLFGVKDVVSVEL